MYLEREKKLAQKMGTQHTKLKIFLCEKFVSLTIVTWTNNCYLYNLLLCNYQDPKLLKDLYLNLLQFTYPSTKKVLKNYYERTADNWWYNLTWFFLTLTLHTLLFPNYCNLVSELLPILIQFENYYYRAKQTKQKSKKLIFTHTRFFFTTKPLLYYMLLLSTNS